MRIMMKMFLLILSHIPLKSVANVAYSKINELDSLSSSKTLRSKLYDAKSRFILLGGDLSSIDELKIRYAEITGLQGKELDDLFKNDLILLKYSGLIDFDEKMVLSGGRSEHATNGKK